VEGVLNDIARLGRLMGGHNEADTLVEHLRAELEALRMDRPEGDSIAPRPRVFISLMRPAGPVDTLYSTGPGSFLSELVVMAGGRNIFDDLTEAYPRISKEALIVRQPDVILEILPGGVGVEAWVNDWRPLATLGAVQRGDVRVVNEPAVIVPGPRLPTALRAIRAALHPDLASLDEALPVVLQPQRHD
jgi:iron complex transport system substrate-binding protein